MKKILVPTDFSECASNALRTASVIARQTNAEIHIIHAYEKPLSGLSLQIDVDISALRELLSYIEQEMERMMGSEFLVGLDVHSHIESDRKIWEMIGLEPYSGMDMVVMGSHGASGVKETFIGSNTQKTVQYAHQPVLVVKDSHDPREFKDVAFASNFSGEAETTFPEIKKILDIFGAKIHLLKVITPANFERTELSEKLMSDFADAVGLENYDCHIFNDVSLEKGIFAFSSTYSMDLIAVGTHGRKGLSHLLLGSLAEQLVNHAAIPVLTMKIENGKIEDPVPLAD